MGPCCSRRDACSASGVFHRLAARRLLRRPERWIWRSRASVRTGSKDFYTALWGTLLDGAYARLCNLQAEGYR
jgi:hypothetical protein